MPVPTSLSAQIVDARGANLDFRMLGCAVDGVTDDTALAQAILNTAANLGLGAPIMLPGDAPMIVSGLTLPTGTAIVSRGYGCIQQLAASAATNTPFITPVAAGLSPWIATTVYVVNALIIDPNGNVQRCTTAGTSGSSIPAFATSGVTSDGSTVKWTFQATPGGILLEGVTFDGNSPNQPGVTGAHLIHLVNVSDVQIRACNFQNSTGRCISGYALNNIQIDSGNYINWQPGNNAAIQFWASEGGPVTGLKIRGVTVDGRPSASSCIKLNGAVPDTRYPSWTNDWPIKQIYVGDGVTCYTAPGLLGVELWSDKQYSYTDFILNGIQVYGVFNNDYGISCGGSGGSRGEVSNFQLNNCQLGLEVSSGQNITAGPGSIYGGGLGSSFLDCTYGSGRGCVLQGVTFDGMVQGVACSAANADSLGPYSAVGVSIINCEFNGIPSGNCGVSVLANATGAIVSKVRIIACGFTGAPGSTGTKGVLIDPTAGTTVDRTMVGFCSFDNLANGVYMQSNDTNGRYIYNDFTPSVTTPYNNTAIPTDIFLAAGSAGPGILIGGAGTSSPIVELQNTSLSDQTEVLFEFLGNNDPAMTMFDHTLTRMVQFRWDSGSISFVNAPFVAGAAARWLTGALEAAGVFSVSVAADGSGSLFLKSASSSIGSFIPGTNASGPAIINAGLNVVDGFGCNGKTAQTPVASGGAISPASVSTTAPTQTTPWGATTAAQFNDCVAAINGLLALTNAMRAALVANGIMS